MAKGDKDTSSADGEKISVREARKLFPSLFLGLGLNDEPRDKPAKNDEHSTSSPSVQAATSQSLPARQHKAGPEVKREDDGEGTQQSAAAKAAENASEQIANLIKKDGRELRESWLFKETYKQVQWQRDSYFVGPEFANWSRRRRLRESGTDARSVKAYLTLMPYEGDESVASQQLTKIAADFIPSITVKNALLPIVLKLPQSTLYRPTQTALVNIIRSQQGTLDRVIKKGILSFLHNPANRQKIKNSTKGYMKQYEKD